jgi:polyisoprenoid-binding protein YceI
MSRTLVLFLFLSLPAAAAPATFMIDSDKSELLAFTEPTGLFKGASHSHVIRAAKGVAGKIVFDAEAVSASWVSVSLPVSGLVVDEPSLRKRESMTTMPSEKDRGEIDKTMRSEKQLDESHWGQISFDSNKVVDKGDGKLEITGRFALHGVKKNITLPISYQVKGDIFRGQGEVTITHKDFGMEPITAVLGTVRNAEPIRLKILLVGSVKQPAKAEAAPASAGEKSAVAAP